MTVITGYLVDTVKHSPTESRVGRSFNIALSFYAPRQNDEVTYLTMSEGTEPRRLRSEDGWLASIPIRHPAGVVIDESNWAGFLQLNAYTLGNSKIEMPKSVLHVRGFKLLEAFPSIGRYCFLFECVGMSFAVVMDRPEGSSMVYRPYPIGLIIKYPWGDKEMPRSIGFNNEGIYVQYQMINHSLLRRPGGYAAMFLTKLPPHRELQIHLDKKSAFAFSGFKFREVPETMAMELDAISKERTFRETKGLIPKSFRGFEYFQSVDSELIVTIQQDPVHKAFSAVKMALDDIATGGEDERYHTATQRYNWTAMEYVLGKKDVDNDRLTLLRCIEIMESTEFNLPKNPLPDHTPEM